MRLFPLFSTFLGLALLVACNSESSPSEKKQEETLPRLPDGEYCMVPEDGFEGQFISFTISGTGLEGLVHTTNDEGEKIAFMCFGTLEGDTLAKVYISLPAIDAELYEEWAILPGPGIRVLQGNINKEGIYRPEPCASLHPESYPVSEFERADQDPDAGYSCYGPLASKIQQADTLREYLTLSLGIEKGQVNKIEGWGSGENDRGLSWASEITGLASEEGVFEVKVIYTFSDGTSHHSSETWKMPSPSDYIQVTRADSKRPGLQSYELIACEEKPE